MFVSSPCESTGQYHTKYCLGRASRMSDKQDALSTELQRHERRWQDSNLRPSGYEPKMFVCPFR
jgi:hypothetical protein